MKKMLYHLLPATVHTVDMPGERADGKGDGIAGGRLNYRYTGSSKYGVPGVYESMRRPWQGREKIS